jgi:hypothetical protein
MSNQTLNLFQVRIEHGRSFVQLFTMHQGTAADVRVQFLPFVKPGTKVFVEPQSALMKRELVLNLSADATPPHLHLGIHPNHPGKAAILDQVGALHGTFATGTSRAEIAELLALRGHSLMPDDTIVAPIVTEAPRVAADPVAVQ